MQYLFIDESGDHNLLPKKIDPTFPLFVLTGVVFEEEEYEKFKKNLSALKLELFGNQKVILHAEEINRPNKTKQKEIGKLTRKESREAFYRALNALIAKTNFTIFVFAIKKREFAQTIPTALPDPYFLSFADIFTRFIILLRKNEEGVIHAERRNMQFDKQFILAWESAKHSPIGVVTPNDLKEHSITEPKLFNKSWEHAGLELADLISYRVSRKLNNKSDKPEGNEIDYSLLEHKLMDVKVVPQTSKK